MTSTKLLLAAAMLAATAVTARAQCSGGRTSDQVIADCDAAFPSSNPFVASARGWCYIINSFSCSN